MAGYLGAFEGRPLRRIDLSKYRPFVTIRGMCFRGRYNAYTRVTSGEEVAENGDSRFGR